MEFSRRLEAAGRDHDTMRLRDEKGQCVRPGGRTRAQTADAGEVMEMPPLPAKHDT
jgi:hypothetical protein